MDQYRECTNSGGDDYVITQPLSQIMSPGQPISVRYRVNVSTSVKGVKTWDCTVDGDNMEMEEVLKRSDELVAELEKRYPLVLESK